MGFLGSWPLPRKRSVMLKKFYFWVVLSLLVAIASATAIHWKAVEGIRQRTAKVLPLYDRQKVLEGLSLDLEKYRRMSSGFRNLTPVEILETKDHLVKKFDDAITELERLDPSAADHALQGQLKKQLNDLLEGVAEVEPTLFSRDAYVKPAIQTLHDDLVKTLNVLVKNTDGHVVALHLDRNAPQESRSLALLVVAQLVFLFATAPCLAALLIAALLMEAFQEIAAIISLAVFMEFL